MSNDRKTARENLAASVRTKFDVIFENESGERDRKSCEAVDSDDAHHEITRVLKGWTYNVGDTIRIVARVDAVQISGALQFPLGKTEETNNIPPGLEVIHLTTRRYTPGLMEAMPDTVLETLKRLPPIVYTCIKGTREVVAIRRGVIGCYTIDTQDTAETLNSRLDPIPTREQIVAMVNGSMFGWETPSADPATFREIERHVRDPEHE